MLSIAPLRGWFLDEIVRLDGLTPGFAGMVFRASHERRQVIAAYLSRPTNITCPDEINFLSSADHDVILRTAFGSLPNGLRGALRRCGAQPHEKKFYGYLQRLLASEARPEMRVLVARLEQVSPDKLGIARALLPELRMHKLVLALQTVEQAKDLSDLYSKLAGASVDRAEMRSALERARSFSDIRRFARRWSFLARLPPHPVPDCKGYCAIVSAVELRRMAREFSNCMSGYIASVMEGTSSFAVATSEDVKAIVHLHKRGGQWLLEDVYGVDNTPADPNCERLAERHLAAHGIERERRVAARRQWTSLRRLTGHFDPFVGD